jgi:hypothetical protein
MRKGKPRKKHSKSYYAGKKYIKACNKAEKDLSR